MGCPTVRVCSFGVYSHAAACRAAKNSPLPAVHPVLAGGITPRTLAVTELICHPDKVAGGVHFLVAGWRRGQAEGERMLSVLRVPLPCWHHPGCSDGSAVRTSPA